jgi:hypothetical protein
LKEYKSLQIRKVILNCGRNLKEFYPINNNLGIRYYILPDGDVIELKMNENYIEEEINLLVIQIGISIEEFENLYKRARKHQLHG